MSTSSPKNNIEIGETLTEKEMQKAKEDCDNNNVAETCCKLCHSLKDLNSNNQSK